MPNLSEKMITPPWSDAEIKALERHQAERRFHPYTCGRRSEHVNDKEGLLVPTANGWTCPECDYTQAWAWRPVTQGTH